MGWIDVGDRTGYSIQVATPGSYAISARVASAVPGTAFRVLLDGIDVTGTVRVPNTGDWQTWQTVSGGNVTLTAGVHWLTFESLTGWFNLNWIEVQPR